MLSSSIVCELKLTLLGSDSHSLEKWNCTYLRGSGEEVITAFSKTTSEELGGLCTAGIRAVRTTVWGSSVRFDIVARALLSDDTVGVKGTPSSVIEYEAEVAFPHS